MKLGLQTNNIFHKLFVVFAKFAIIDPMSEGEKMTVESVATEALQRADQLLGQERLTAEAQLFGIEKDKDLMFFLGRAMDAVKNRDHTEIGALQGEITQLAGQRTGRPPEQEKAKLLAGMVSEELQIVSGKKGIETTSAMDLIIKTAGENKDSRPTLIGLLKQGTLGGLFTKDIRGQGVRNRLISRIIDMSSSNVPAQGKGSEKPSERKTAQVTAGGNGGREEGRVRGGSGGRGGGGSGEGGNPPPPEGPAAPSAEGGEHGRNYNRYQQRLVDIPIQSERLSKYLQKVIRQLTSVSTDQRAKEILGKALDNLPDYEEFIGNEEDELLILSGAINQMVEEIERKTKKEAGNVGEVTIKAELPKSPEEFRKEVYGKLYDWLAGNKKKPNDWIEGIGTIEIEGKRQPFFEALSSQPLSHWAHLESKYSYGQKEKTTEIWKELQDIVSFAQVVNQRFTEWNASPESKADDDVSISAMYYESMGLLGDEFDRTVKAYIRMAQNLPYDGNVGGHVLGNILLFRILPETDEVLQILETIQYYALGLDYSKRDQSEVKNRFKKNEEKAKFVERLARQLVVGWGYGAWSDTTALNVETDAVRSMHRNEYAKRQRNYAETKKTAMGEAGPLNTVEGAYPNHLLIPELLTVLTVQKKKEEGVQIRSFHELLMRDTWKTYEINWGSNNEGDNFDSWWLQLRNQAINLTNYTLDTEGKELAGLQALPKVGKSIRRLFADEGAIAAYNLYMDTVKKNTVTYGDLTHWRANDWFYYESERDSLKAIQPRSKLRDAQGKYIHQIQKKLFEGYHWALVERGGLPEGEFRKKILNPAVVAKMINLKDADLITGPYNLFDWLPSKLSSILKPKR